ncbi:MAG: VCBS repeat-containing protein, partial [Bacteroidota bacterium]
MSKFTPSQPESPRQKIRLETKLTTSIVTDVVIGTFLAALLTVNTYSSQPLEDVFISVDMSNEITICAEQAAMSLEYLNTSGFSLTGQEITVSFPDGVTYVSGSLSGTSDFAIRETDISELAAPVFEIEDLLDGEIASFSLAYEASIEARDLILNDGVLQNQIRIQTNEGLAEQTTAPYNALYPALNILKITPKDQSLVSGDTASRTIKIVNGGYGRVENFFLTDIHDQGLELVATDLGTINATKDTIFFGSSDFTGIGNNDGYFDPYENLFVTEYLIAGGCNGSTMSSSLQAGWSCGDQVVVDASMNANISAVLKLPNLSLSTQNALSNCFGDGNANNQEITIKNNGQGVALDVELDIWKSKGGNYNQNILSRFDTASLTIQIHGGAKEKIIPHTVFNTKNTNAYACLGDNPIGRVVLALPNIPAGATAVINWDTYNCCPNVCNKEVNTGWKTSLSYNDACQTSVKTASKVGENDLTGNMSVFPESPSDLSDGQIGEYVFTVSSFKNNMPKGTGAHYELSFDVPAGLKWVGGEEDLRFHVGAKEWDAMSIEYDSNSRQLTAKYLHPAPFNIRKSEILLYLTADCSEISGESKEVQLGLTVNYIVDTTCSQGCSIPFLCETSSTTELKCPGPCAEGVAMSYYKIARTSFGLADNNLDGKPDAGGELDMSEVRESRAMVGDTLRATIAGRVSGSTSVPSFGYGYASSNFELGENLTDLGASVKIYDASSASYLTCDQVQVSRSTSGTNATFSYDFSPTVLGASCSALSGFEFANGDSLWVYADYKVTGNIGGKVQQVEIENQFYLSQIASPTSSSDKYACINWDGRYTLIGYYWLNEKGSNTSITSCSKTINQDFKLSIGDCCSNYNGGNLFPYEYRYWGHVKRAEFTIPDHYEVLDIYIKNRRTKYTNSTVTENVNNIQPDQVSGNTYSFDLEQYYIEHGGSMNYSDDGFRGTMYIELAPSCDVPKDVYEDVEWKFTFQEAEILSNAETDWYTSNPDKIKYSPASLQLSSPNPVIDGLAKNISWDVNVKASGAGMSNSWLHFQVPNADVNISSVVDKSSGDTLAYQGDIYQIGDISSGATKTFQINASYSACEPTYIMAYSGYECSSYPNTFADFTCEYVSKRLEVEPEEADLQMRINGDRQSVNCVIYTDVEIELASVKIGYVNDVLLDVELPAGNSMSLIVDSTRIKYPLSADYTYLSNLSVVDNKFQFNLNELVPEIGEEGLPGITDTDKNRVKIAFRVKNEEGYVAGDMISMSTESSASCGKELESLSLPFDVNTSFKKPSIPGLTDDPGDSWSAAWGDFNNDGYEDLYVAEFNHWEGGKLYINRGAGQFEVSVNAGTPISDKGASAGSSWGDFDNDGDLDLFVSNN